MLSTGEFPGLEQSNPVEDGLSPAMRLTVHLQINPHEHNQPPEIFILVTLEEVTKAKNAQGGINLLLKGKITQTSFTEPNGNAVHTSIQKDSESTWRARTIDGLRWKFDKSQGRWTKDSALEA